MNWGQVDEDGSRQRGMAEGDEVEPVPARLPNRPRAPRPLIGAAAVAVLAGALAVGVGPLGQGVLDRVRPGPDGKRPTSGEEVIAALPAPGRAPVPGELAGAGNLVPLGDQVIELALEARSVFALLSVNRPAIPVVLVARVDRQTRHVVWSRPLPGGSDLALAGGWLWVIGGAVPGSTRDDARGLYRLDSGSLELMERIDLPEPPSESAAYSTALAATPTGPLWLAVARHLHRLDPATGRIEATWVTDHSVADLAVDPEGTHLYVLERGGDLVVSRLDARSGVVQHRRPGLGGRGGGRLSATGDGVWAFYPTGRRGEGEAVLLRAGDLEPVATVSGPSSKTTGTDLIGGTVGGGTLWVSDLGGVFCADPATGRSRAAAAQAERGPVAADESGVYVGSGGGLTIVRPDPRCRP